MTPLPLVSWQAVPIWGHLGSILQLGSLLLRVTRVAVPMVGGGGPRVPLAALLDPTKP